VAMLLGLEGEFELWHEHFVRPNAVGRLEG
jgi:hypothetical protein